MKYAIRISADGRSQPATIARSLNTTISGTRVSASHNSDISPWTRKLARYAIAEAALTRNWSANSRR
jgi:hypothetical protein